MKNLMLIFILCFPFNSYAELWKPDIFAICRITLKSGTQIEGYVEIANGSYAKYIDVHGFYYEYYEGGLRLGQTLRFDVDFRWIEPHDAQIHVADDSKKSLNIVPAKVYYLQETTTATYGQINIKREKQESRDGNDIILARKFTEQTAFKLSKFIPIYKTLDQIYPAAGENSSKGKSTQIPLRLIVRLELLDSPSEEILNKISTKEQSWNAIMEARGIEYVPPVWFHEIVDVDTDKCETLKCKTFSTKAFNELVSAVQHANSNWR